MRACCFTGHRVIPEEKLEHVEHELRREIKNAIDDGITLFISGFAKGADLLFAQIVCEYRESIDNIQLEAALPYSKWANRTDKPFPELLQKCSIVGSISKEYSPDCFMKRNMFMVDMSERVITAYDGRGKGGTYNTIVYARKQKKEIRTIIIF